MSGAVLSIIESSGRSTSWWCYESNHTHECLHDVQMTINGVKTSNISGMLPSKLYRGQQLVMFGQYEVGGEAELVLQARLTGEDKTYRTTFRFPSWTSRYHDFWFCGPPRFAEFP